MLAILTTHPIQYQVPLWQALARDGRVPFEVWYLTRHGVEVSHDREFGKAFAWDIDILEGYSHRFLDVAPAATPTRVWACRLQEPLRRRLTASGSRVLWLQGWQVLAYWQAVWEARAAGVEVWLRGESNDLAPTPAWKRPPKRVLLEQLFRRVDRFLYIGAANKRLYSGFGVPEERLHPAPYAVDNERFARQAADLRGRRMELRRRWGIPDEAFCVLFCGKFVEKKRPLDLVAAALLMAARGRRVHLLFAGSGELGAELRARCTVVSDAESEHASAGRLAAPELAPPASFAGFLNQTEVSRAYVAADCLALPSDSGETWGLVVNEAMASGLPCVVSNQCGCAEDLACELPNLTFRCGSIEALSDAIERVAAVGPALGTGRALASLDQTVTIVVDRYLAATTLSQGSA